MTASNDRRSNQRFQAKPGSRILYGATSADIRDLSVDGVFVSDPDPLPVGSEIIFALKLASRKFRWRGLSGTL